VAALLGHEGFHAAIRIGGAQGWRGQTVANEAFAYSMGYHVADQLGVAAGFSSELSPLSGKLQGISPYSDVKKLGDQLGSSRRAINDAYSQAYGVENYRVAWSNWPGYMGLPLGRGKFLDVAKSVWIK
jgi:hypothetical protein